MKCSVKGQDFDDYDYKWAGHSGDSLPYCPHCGSCTYDPDHRENHPLEEEELKPCHFDTVPPCQNDTVSLSQMVNSVTHSRYYACVGFSYTLTVITRTTKKTVLSALSCKFRNVI